MFPCNAGFFMPAIFAGSKMRTRLDVAAGLAGLLKAKLIFECWNFLRLGGSDYLIVANGSRLVPLTTTPGVEDSTLLLPAMLPSVAGFFCLEFHR